MAKIQVGMNDSLEFVTENAHKAFFESAANAVADALQTEFKSGADVQESKGQFFVDVDLPNGDTMQVQFDTSGGNPAWVIVIDSAKWPATSDGDMEAEYPLIRYVRAVTQAALDLYDEVLENS